jgi:tRNA pseudouridine38-40 synthase
MKTEARAEHRSRETFPHHTRLLLQYDGTDYHGWQIQRDARTIQGEVERALLEIFGVPIRVAGASRTDAGVHALGQVACFSSDLGIEPDGLLKALNSLLPRDIRVVAVRPASPEFHARFSPGKKEYRYRISTGPVVSPFLYRYVTPARCRLSLEKMQAAAALFCGELDMRAFTNTGSDQRTFVRRIYSSSVEAAGDEIHYSIAASGFLKQMVRNIVGTLVEVGRGRLDSDEVKSIIASGDRKRAGPTMEARGLCLMRVTYLGEAETISTA